MPSDMVLPISEAWTLSTVRETFFTFYSAEEAIIPLSLASLVVSGVSFAGVNREPVSNSSVEVVFN